MNRNQWIAYILWKLWETAKKFGGFGGGIARGMFRGFFRYALGRRRFF
jgi:hypothetical protein